MDTQPAKGEDCQCEMEETNKPLLPFQSNFARQLHENEVMQRRRPTINTTSQQIEARPQHPIQYTQQKAISHAPQQQQQQQAITSQKALQYTRPPVIEHNQQTSQQARTQYPVMNHTPQEVLQDVIQHNRIENMETDYQSPALQHTQKQQLEYIPHEALQHTQPPALQHSPQQQVLQYSQKLQQALQQLQPAAFQDTQSKMELGFNPEQALTYNQGSHQQMGFTHKP